MALSRDTQRRIERHIANLAHLDNDVAFKAEVHLIRFGAKAVDALIPATESPNPQVRFRAVWALGKIGDPRGFESIARLTQDEDECVSYDATLALEKLGDRRAVPILIEHTLYEGDVERFSVQADESARILSLLGDASIAALKEVAESDGQHARQRALRTLANWEERQAENQSDA